MSQSLKLKVAMQGEHVVSNGNNAPRNRLSIPTTAEDSQSRSANPKERRKNKSKNKIPKSVRYDLESALVGLCDAWFEDIKPHLVRNNIKLHNTKADARAACASGDFEQPRTDAPPCTHIDPGAASDLHRQKDAFCVGSCVMPSTVSEAHLFRPQTSIIRQFQTLRVNQSSPHDLPQNCRQNSDVKMTFRKKSNSQSRRVSRTCQTYNILPASITEPPPFRDVYIRALFKSIFNKVPICPVASPNTALPKSTQQTVSVASNTDRPNAETHCRSRSIAEAQNITRQKLGRDPPMLFPNDLIHIMGKRNDMILRNICESHEKVGYPSMIELVSPKDRKKTAGGPKKNPPWR